MNAFTRLAVTATLAAGLALWSGPAAAYTLVLQTGARMKLKGRPIHDMAGNYVIETADGRRLTLPPTAISWSSTNAANAPKPKTPSRTWTEEDIRRLRRGSTVSVLGSEASTAGATAPGATTQPADPNAPQVAPATLPTQPTAADEAEWRGKARSLHDRIALLEGKRNWLLAAEESWELWVLGTATYGNSPAASNIVNLQQQRARVEAELTQTRGELVAFKERARRANVPPGWTR